MNIKNWTTCETLEQAKTLESAGFLGMTFRNMKLKYDRDDETWGVFDPVKRGRVLFSGSLEEIEKSTR
jgi:hypothetical protein